jgi:hypothetical protein
MQLHERGWQWRCDHQRYQSCLRPPADNGGPTDTIALLPGSLAIDVVPAAVCPATDQRGFTRPDFGEAFCDVGAYESQETFAGVPGTSNCQGKSDHLSAIFQKCAS